MYAALFLLFLVVCAGVQYRTWRKAGTTVDHSPEFSSFQRSYVLIWLLVTAADWLQGSHVYALYEKYGYHRGSIGLLFVVGFASSMVFGTFVGGLADKYGRKRFALLYCVIYALSCLTKHSGSFGVLLIGRVLGGIATSLLFSVFESWMVHAHKERGFEASLLASTFSFATIGTSMVAVACGVAANVLADAFGYVAPFDLSIFLLCIAGFLIYVMWTENHGDARASNWDSFRVAVDVIKSDPRVMYLGAAQALFEGAMYSFVFSWTPALAALEPGREIPYGYVFAVFMECVMFGSAAFSFVNEERRVSPDRYLPILFLFAAACMYVPVFTTSLSLVRLSFFSFEFAVGMFWPAISTLRSKFVPEDIRSTVMNLFRVPLNVVVLVVLWNSGSWSLQQVFMVNVVLLLAAAGFAQLFKLKATDGRSS